MTKSKEGELESLFDAMPLPARAAGSVSKKDITGRQKPQQKIEGHPVNTQNFALSHGLTTASQIARSSNSTIRRCLQVALVGLSLMVASVAGAGDKIIISDSGTVATTNLKSEYGTTKNPVTTFTIAEGESEQIVGFRFTLSQAVPDTKISARITKENDDDFLVEGSISDAPLTGTPYLIEFARFSADDGTYIVDMKSDSTGATPAVRFTGTAVLEDSLEDEDSEVPFCDLPLKNGDNTFDPKQVVPKQVECLFVVPEGVSEITLDMWGGGGAGGDGGGSPPSAGGGGGGAAYISGSIAVSSFESFILKPGAAGHDSKITGLVPQVLVAGKGGAGVNAAEEGAPGDGGEPVAVDGDQSVKLPSCQPVAVLPFCGYPGDEGVDSNGGNAGGFSETGSGEGGTGATANNGNGSPGDAFGGGGGGGSGNGKGAAGGAGRILITYTVVPVPASLQFTTASPATVDHGETLSLEVEVRDQFGDIMVDDNTSSVAFSKASGTGSVTGLTSATVTAGMADIDVVGDRAGPVTITATLDDLSAELEVTVVAVAPSAPQNVQVRPAVNGLRASWSAPASDGGQPIVSYTATANPSCQVMAVPGVTDYSCLISPLDPEESYQVMVTATNGSEVSDPAMAGGGSNGGSDGGFFQPLTEPLPVPTLSFWAMLLLILLSVWVAGQCLMSRRRSH